MCNATTIMAGASLGLEVGSAITSHAAQNSAANKNAQAANTALYEQWKDLGIRQQQEQTAGSQQVAESVQRTQVATGQTIAAASGAGVTGLSLKLITGDLSAEGSQQQLATERNTADTVTQLQRAKLGAAAEAQSRANSQPGASPFDTALKIGASALEFGNTLYTRSHPKGS